MPRIGIDIEARTGKAESEISGFARKVAAEFQKTLKLNKLEAQALAQIISKKKNLVVTENDVIKAKKMAAVVTREEIKLSSVLRDKTVQQMITQRKKILLQKKLLAGSRKYIAAKKREEKAAKSASVAGLRGMKQQEGLFARVNKHVFRYRMALISVMVAAYALNRIITAAWNFTYVGAQINEQMESLHRLSVRYGTTANKLIADMRRVSKETLSNAEIAKSAGKAMVMGIAAETTVKLMKIATAASRVMGKTSAEMFADITLGTARMSKKILDNIGIIVDWRAAYKKHAAELNISTRALSSQQKMVARTNAIMEAGSVIIDTVSGQLLTQRQVLDKLTASWSNWFDKLKQGWIDIIIPLKGLEKARKYISNLQNQIKELEGLQKRGAGRTLWGFGQPIGEAIAGLKKRIAFVKSFVGASDANLLNQEKIRLAKIAQREEDEKRLVIVGKLGKLYVKMYNDQEKVARKTSAQIGMLDVQFEERKLGESARILILSGKLYKDFEKRKLDIVMQAEKLLVDFEIQKEKLRVDRITKTQVQIEQLMAQFEKRKADARKKALPELLSFYEKIREMQYISVRASEGTHKKLIESLTGTDETYLTNKKFVDTQIRDFKLQKLEQEYAAHASVIRKMYQNEQKFVAGVALLQEWKLNKAKEINDEWARQHGTITEKVKLQIADVQKYASEQAKLITGRLPTAILDSFVNKTSDAFYDVARGAKTAKEAVKDFALSFMRDMTRMIIKAMMWQAVSSMIGGPAATPAATPAVKGAAEGAVFPGHFTPVRQFASGGIVRRPTLGLIGEGNKPEAVIPLKGGKVPVDMPAQQQQPITIVNVMDKTMIEQVVVEQLAKNRQLIVNIMQDDFQGGGTTYQQNRRMR